MLQVIFKNLIFSSITQIAAFLGRQVLAAQLSEPNIYFLLFTQILLILVFGLLFKLERRWIILNILLPLALFIGSSSVNASWLWLPLLFLILLYLPTIWTRVPYYPTHFALYEIIAKQLPQDKHFKFLDAGCGDAKLLAHLAQNFPQGEFVGAELSPLSFIAAKFNSSFKGCNNLKIYYKSFWQMDFSDYDFLYAFLAPPPMPALLKKAQAEMKNATLLINSFPLPIQADETFQIPDSRPDRSGALYVYRV